MSVFSDPDYMAKAKAELREYVLTGRVHPNGARVRNVAEGRNHWRLEDFEAVAEALKLAGTRGWYNRYLPRNFRHSDAAVNMAIKNHGGRAAFLAKFGGDK